MPLLMRCWALLGLMILVSYFQITTRDLKIRIAVSFLKTAMDHVRIKGYGIGNLDATIICQKPKLASYLPQMKANIASDLNVTLDQVNLKAKTNESLGHLGRGEGIAVHAVVLLYMA